MPGPWEQYQQQSTPPAQQPEEIGPWQQYAQPETSAEQGPWNAYSPPQGEESRNLIQSKPVTDDELNQIASKYGVDPGELKSAAPYLGAVSGGEIPQAVGIAGSSVGFGLPQKAYKMAQGLRDPKLEKALDEVSRLAEERKSYGRLGAEMLLPTAATLGVGAPATVGRAALMGAAEGAMFGLGSSSKGEELGGVATGAAIGAPLGAAGHLAVQGLGKLLSKTHLEDIEAQLAAKPNLAREAEARLASRQEAEDQLAGRILRGEETPPSHDLVPPELRADILNPDTEIGEKALRRVARTEDLDLSDVRRLASERPQEYEKAVLDGAAQQIQERELRNFAESVQRGGGRSADEAEKVLAYAREHDPTALEQKFQNYRKARAWDEIVSERGIQHAGGPVSDTLHNVANWVSDNQFVARHIDEKWQLGLEKALQDITKGEYRATQKLPAVQAMQKEASEILQKAGLDPNALTKALEYHNYTGLDGEQIAAAKQIEDLFGRIRGELSAGDAEHAVPGLPITQLESKTGKTGYLPQMRVATPEYIARVEARETALAQQLGKPLTEINQSEYQRLLGEHPEFQDFVRGVVGPDQGWTAPRDVREFRAKLAEAKSLRQGEGRLQTVATAALQRGGDMPDWVRETNVIRLLGSSYRNSLRHMYLREPMQRLELARKQLGTVGDTTSAKWLDRLQRDITGGRTALSGASLTKGVADNIRLMAARKLQQAQPGTANYALYSMLRNAPEVMAGMANNIYNNTMGLSARTVFRNLLQTPTMTAPEIGGSYGYLANAVGALRGAATWRSALAKLQKMNLVPEQITHEAIQTLEQDIAQSGLYKMSQSAVRQYAQVTGALFRASETANRIITLRTAEKVASDMMRQTPSAMAALGRMPGMLQQELVAGIRAGNAELVERRVAEHLMATTMFHYTRSNMSQFGRSMGPIFSVFSKWPTAVAGDILTKYRSQPAGQATMALAQKYLAPMILLGTAQNILLGNPKEMSDSQKLVVGSQGLLDWAPAMSLKNVLAGDVARPPAIDAFLPLLGSAKELMQPEPDIEKVKQGAYQTGQAALTSFVPFMSLVRFLATDLPTYQTGVSPDKNLLRRVLEE